MLFAGQPPNVREHAKLLTFPGPFFNFAICALYVPSSLSSFLILTSIDPTRVSV